MSMGKGKKIAIGCVIALVLACLISAAVMVVGGAWIKSKVGGLLGGVMDTGKNAQAIQKLDQTFAYSEPGDGLVPEARLQAYIAVCAKVKPAVDKLQEFTKSKVGGNSGSWTDAKDALKFTADLITAVRQGLEEQKMSPKEFHFIGNVMKMASAQTPIESGGQPLDASQRQAKEKFLLESEKVLADPTLPEDQRAKTQETVDQIRQELEQAPSADPNVVLYLKYKDRLKQVDLQGLEGVAFQQSPEKP